MRAACVFVIGFWSLSAFAQPGGNNNDLVVTLYTQVEALQQEVQNLRGMVEEQAFQIRRMQTEQRDRYIDLDQRLSEMTGGGAPVAGAPGTTVPGAGVAAPPADPSMTQTPGQAANQGQGAVPVQPPADTFASSTPSPAPAVAPQQNPAAAVAPVPQMEEQELYRAALNLLLEQSQYEESVRYFQSYIDTYPQGRLLTNSLYWQGEALILVARLNEARDVFSRLLAEHPQDPKAPDAMLKLGVVYNQMGDRGKATETWREIATRYPEAVSVNNLARDYLNNRR